MFFSALLPCFRTGEHRSISVLSFAFLISFITEIFIIIIKFFPFACQNVVELRCKLEGLNKTVIINCVLLVCTFGVNAMS